MKIAINALSFNNTKAGMGNYIYHLVNHLAIVDKKNIYYIFISEKNRSFFQIKQKNFNIVNIGSLVTNRFFRLIWEQFFLPLSLLKNKIEVLHSPGFVLPFFSSSKSVVTIADMTFITLPKYHTLLKRFYFKLFMPFSIKRADKVISISESTRKDILKTIKVSPDKIKTIYLAADKAFKLLDKESSRQYIRKKFKIDSPFILFVGMIEPRKNLKDLFEAFSQLKKEAIPHKLVIVGKKGWMYKDLFKMIKRSGIKKDVVFTGYVPDDDLVKFYNAAELFVYPSFYEGFGIPILEAMACGCPVITSNVSSMPEVAGNAALLIDPKSVKDIADAIKKVINDKELQKKMGKQGVKQSLRFSWKKTAEQTLKIYEEAYKNSGKMG